MSWVPLTWGEPLTELYHCAGWAKKRRRAYPPRSTPVSATVMGLALIALLKGLSIAVSDFVTLSPTLVQSSQRKSKALHRHYCPSINK